MGALVKLKERFEKFVIEELLSERVLVKASLRLKVLTPEEVIGTPERDDYPLLKGKEVMIECDFRGSKGQAFTDQPGDFEGTLKDVLDMEFISNYERAIFIATLNAVMRFLGVVRGTVHCKNEYPGMCGKEVGSWVKSHFPNVRRVGLIGLQPSLLDGLISEFGAENVTVTDLNPENIGKDRGVIVLDGCSYTEELVRNVDVILATGSTFVNGTFDEIEAFARDCGKFLVVYGVTGAAAAFLLGVTRYCPYAT